MDAETVERIRRIASVIATTIFCVSFFLLLILSATTVWFPGNVWLDRLQMTLQTSGLFALVFALIPPAERAAARIAGWLGFGEDSQPHS